MPKENEYVEIECEFKHSTQAAVLVALNDDEHWIPRSLISYTCDKQIDDLSEGDEFTLTVIAWKAMQLGVA